MIKRIKNIINLILASIPLAMGIAVIVFTTIDANVEINHLIRLLGIAAFSLGLLALNNMPKEEK
jgi:peroxiredoxin family protein